MMFFNVNLARPIEVAVGCFPSNSVSVILFWIHTGLRKVFLWHRGHVPLLRSIQSNAKSPLFFCTTHELNPAWTPKRFAWVSPRYIKGIVSVSEEEHVPYTSYTQVGFCSPDNTQKWSQKHNFLPVASSRVCSKKLCFWVLGKNPACVRCN